jgi:gamma-tubulin complex component 5
MAHAATISRLADNLARSVLGSSHDDIPYTQIRDNAAKALRNSGHARTNQFAIKSTLEGLIEKFSVLNRDDLAEALQARLDELPSKSKWLPEILSLLLTLSDRPLEKTKLDDLRILEVQPEQEAPALTWQELVSGDHAAEAGLWDDVERGYHSSGDEATIDGSDAAASTEATSVTEDDVTAIARLQIISVDEDTLEDIESFHDRMHDGEGSQTVSELTSIRETFSMLHGLPTSIYAIGESGQVHPRISFRLETASSETQWDAMLHFAEFGTSINQLRKWGRSPQLVPYIQSCQSAVQQLLMEFSRHLANLERRYIPNDINVVVSVMNMKAEVEKYSRPLLRLSDVVSSVQQQTVKPDFTLLDELYDGVCMAQLSSDETTFATLLPVLMAGLKTYLKSISSWIRNGSCRSSDFTSLAEERHAACPLGRFWQDRFAMRRQADRSPHAPKLLRPFAERVFALGKSRAFLEALNEDRNVLADDGYVPSHDFSMLETSSTANSFLPFSQLIEGSIKSWLAESANDCTPSLRRALLEDHGLLKNLRSLNRTLCSEDGSAFQAFADTLFWSMDDSISTWKNSFLMTELAQSTLGNGVDDSSLVVRIGDTAIAQSSIQRLACITLETTFAWPIQNITQTPSPVTYSKVFTLLLQVYRAKYLLRCQFPDLQRLTGTRSGRTNVLAALLRLRCHLIAVVDTLYAHITTTATTISHSLLREIETAEDIDAMGNVWARHERQLETSLLLGEKLAPLYRAIVSYLELCERFADIWNTSLGRQRPSQETEGTAPPQDHVKSSRIEALQEESNQSLSFISAGLRGIGRAGGNTPLESLAERLEWIVH